jgi:hypothetical protein
MPEVPALGEHHRRAALVARRDHCVVAHRAAGLDELVWSRRISDAPNRTVSEVRLLEEPPLRLGAHGWKVRLFVRWENGGEHAHLYLDGEAGFLYFMGW